MAIHFNKQSDKLCQTLRLTALAMACATAVTGLASGVGAATAAIDWVPTEQLSDAQKSAIPSHCSGLYVQPALASDQPLLSYEQAPTVVDSDDFSGQGDEVEFRGNVVVQKSDRRLSSEVVRINQTAQTVDVPGALQYRETGLLVDADSGSVDQANDTISLENARYLLHDANLRGSAASFSKDTAQQFNLQQPEFTTCAPDSSFWSLKSGDLAIDTENSVATAHNVRLKIKNIPVLYTPYLRFPIGGERQSGLLFPDLSYSNEDGADITIPYYFNLAANYDATFAPRYIEERGVLLQTEFRYLTEASEGSLALGFLGNDDNYDDRRLAGVGDISSPSEENDDDSLRTGDFDKQDRWYINYNNKTQLSSRWRTRIDFSSVSDIDYFRDLGTGLGTSARQDLLRLGELAYTGESWSLLTRVQSYQNLDDNIDSYERLPQVLLNYTGGVGSWGGEWIFNSEWAEYDRDNDRLTDLSRLVGSRSHTEAGVRFPLEWNAGFLTATAKVQHTSYDLDDSEGVVVNTIRDGVIVKSVQVDDTPDRTVNIFSLDGGMFFERDLKWSDSNFVQTLEPRFYYLYVEDENDQELLPDFDTSDLTFGYQSLFRENRFSGKDRVGDARQLSLAVTSRIYNDAGQQLISASLGRIIYFRDREVQLRDLGTSSEYSQYHRRDSSAWLARMRVNLDNYWSVNSEIAWHHQSNQTDSSQVSLRYRRDNQHLVNLSFRLRNQNISTQSNTREETDFSFIWPLGDTVSVIGRWNYDLEDKQTQESFLGFQWDNCCVMMRLINRRYLKNRALDFDDGFFDAGDNSAKQGIFFQIQLKGLGGFGTKLETVLDDGIPGYRRYDG